MLEQSHLRGDAAKGAVEEPKISERTFDLSACTGVAIKKFGDGSAFHGRADQSTTQTIDVIPLPRVTEIIRGEMWEQARNNSPTKLVAAMGEGSGALDLGQLFFQELFVIELCVVTVLGQQLVMRA